MSNIKLFFRYMYLVYLNDQEQMKKKLHINALASVKCYKCINKLLLIFGTGRVVVHKLINKKCSTCRQNANLTQNTLDVEI